MAVSPDPDYEAHHADYVNRPSAYWDWAARRFGGEDNGWKAVLHCGGSVHYNRYLDFIHQRALKPYIVDSRSRRVLDAGCGVGRLTARFASQRARVIGVDRSLNMLNVARRSVGRPFGQMDLTRLAFRFDTFELVTCSIVLLHFTRDEDFQQAISELIRVTRVGGYLIILDEVPKARQSGDMGCKRTLEEYRAAIEAAGGEIESADLIAVSPYRFVLDRIQNSHLPSLVKATASWLSYMVLGLADLTLTRIKSMPARFWMEDRLLLVRKPASGPSFRSPVHS